MEERWEPMRIEIADVRSPVEIISLIRQSQETFVENDGTIETVDELVSSHSDQDSDNDGTIDELVSSHSDHDWEFRYFKLEFIHE